MNLFTYVFQTYAWTILLLEVLNWKNYSFHLKVEIQFFTIFSCFWHPKWARCQVGGLTFPIAVHWNNLQIFQTVFPKLKQFFPNWRNTSETVIFVKRGHFCTNWIVTVKWHLRSPQSRGINLSNKQQVKNENCATIGSTTVSVTWSVTPTHLLIDWLIDCFTAHQHRTAISAKKHS